MVALLSSFAGRFFPLLISLHPFLIFSVLSPRLSLPDYLFSFHRSLSFPPSLLLTHSLSLPASLSHSPFSLHLSLPLSLPPFFPYSITSLPHSLPPFLPPSFPSSLPPLFHHFPSSFPLSLPPFLPYSITSLPHSLSHPVPPSLLYSITPFILPAPPTSHRSYTNLFSQQLLTIDGEQLRQDPIQVMEQVQSFIGVKTIIDYGTKLR